MTPLCKAPPPPTGSTVDAMPSMLRSLLGDLLTPRPWIYYLDLSLSATVGWGAATGFVLLESAPLRAVTFLLAVLALYRAMTFIHEIIHVRRRVHHLRTLWEILVGVPLFLPSFLYVGVHEAHHARHSYGTRGDPEYAPIRTWTRRLLFVAGMVLLPALLILRCALGPLSWFVPRLRRYVWRRWSALQMNPAYRRHGRPRDGVARREALGFGWLLVCGIACAREVVPMHVVWEILGLLVAISVLNGARTLTSHTFIGDGAPMSTAAQLADSVTLEMNPILGELFAPLGLRFHALHHLVPGLPYHALAEAHRRVASIPDASLYRETIVTLRTARATGRSHPLPPLHALSREPAGLGRVRSTAIATGTADPDGRALEQV